MLVGERDDEERLSKFTVAQYLSTKLPGLFLGHFVCIGAKLGTGGREREEEGGRGKRVRVCAAGMILIRFEAGKV